jgi:hypothetical protein
MPGCPGKNSVREGPTPLALSSDREAIEVALASSLAGDQPRIYRIRNTASLGEFWVSPALLESVRSNPALTVLDEPHAMAFDPDGNLF